MWAGGRVFPLPSKPLPERHPQQPTEDLLAGWSQCVVHAAPAGGPGERDTPETHFQAESQQKSNLSGFGLQEPDSPTTLGDPVSRMQLVFDDEEEEEGREAATDRADAGSSRDLQEPDNTALLHSSWELGQNSHLTQAQDPSASPLFLTWVCFLVFGQMTTWTSSWVTYLRTPTASDSEPARLHLEVASTASC